jgi:CubicO group peptidase (beta-lactamase class C family)
MRLLMVVLASLLVAVPMFAATPFETFVDGVMAREMAASHVPGAVVVVVRDGSVVFSKGYGYANLRARTPVDPERTIFRIGSITKVFTALSVMQLANRGKLALTDDVNRYLPSWKIPSTYAQPITFANLLTHSAGLDEISSGRKAKTAAGVLPLGEFLSTRIVRRMPPGKIISYSTYNMALAGYALESIAGVHLRDYFTANIFAPLAMTRTTLGAIPAAQQRDLAIGYAYTLRRHRPLDFEYFHTYPASDINSTGADMGRFMLAQLRDDAMREMQRRQFANHPRLAGIGYGWFENRRNGVAAIEHGGVMDGYSALLYLAPEKHLGIYIAGNIESSGFPVAVRNAIVDRELAAAPAPPPSPALAASVDRFAGTYRNDTWCHSCAPGTRGYLPSPVKVTANSDGTITLWGGRWMQVEPLVFRLTGGRLDNGEVVIAFREDAAGRITHFFNATWSHEKIDDATPAAMSVPLATLQQYAGRYELAPDQILTITLSGGRLTGELTGQPAAELVATSETTFVAADADAQLTFGSGTVVLRFGGRELRGKKIARSQ